MRLVDEGELSHLLELRLVYRDQGVRVFLLAWLGNSLNGFLESLVVEVGKVWSHFQLALQVVETPGALTHLPEALSKGVFLRQLVDDGQVTLV